MRLFVYVHLDGQLYTSIYYPSYLSMVRKIYSFYKPWFPFFDKVLRVYHSTIGA